MTLTMNLPQSGKSVHSDNEWRWLFHHIAPVFVKEQNDKTSFQQGGHHSNAILMSIIWTKDPGVLETGGRQVLAMNSPSALSGFLLDFIL